jgi:hypothetical protein
MVVDMGQDRCFSAMTPHVQSNRPYDSLLANVDKLRRWSSSDAAVAYDKVCLVTGGDGVRNAARTGKEEL